MNTRRGFLGAILGAMATACGLKFSEGKPQTEAKGHFSMMYTLESIYSPELIPGPSCQQYRLTITTRRPDGSFFTEEKVGKIKIVCAPTRINWPYPMKCVPVDENGKILI